jgi:short-subunit dehydrogenase
MFEYRGKVALITGASSGIGAVFARELAGRGMNVVLVARSADKLHALADELRGQYSIRAEVVPADLSKEVAGQDVFDACARLGLDVHLLVNNAGFGTGGPFHTTPLERQRDEIAVNVLALVDLSHRFLPGMLARKAGGIINVGSTAAFQPIPYMAVYAATKAFVLSFSEALWGECRGNGVTVVAVCPGPVETPFFDHLSLPRSFFGHRDTSEHVVAQGLRALERGRSHVITRMRDYLKAQAGRFLPRGVIPRVLEKALRPPG